MPDSTSRQLVDLTLDEQRSRWLNGDRVRVEELLAELPSLADSREYVVDLVYHEYLLGREVGDGPGLDDLTQRFPDIAEALARQVRLADAVFAGLSSTRDGWRPAIGSPPLPQRIGRLEIESEIGRGRFGVVFSARDPRLQRRVAVKFARQEFADDAEFIRRFEREFVAAAQLEHSGIVRVYDSGVEDGTLYYIMEFCEGENLAEWLETTTLPVPTAVAATIAQQIAAAVQFAHARGVIHRDLKPANVMATPEPDGSLRIRVLDFGLARLLEDESSDTRSSVILGTPLYMAPEQAKRGRGDASTDVFSVGAILYHLLTGQPPFPGENVAEIFTQLETCEPAPPGRLRPGIDRDLETVCMRCLRRFPEDRYQSAGDLAADLERYLGGECVRARAVRVTDRVASWSRHPDRLRDFGLFVTYGILMLLLWTWATLGLGLLYSDAVDAWTVGDVLRGWGFTLASSVPSLLIALVGWRASRQTVQSAELWGGLCIVATLACYALGVQVSLFPPPTPWYAAHPLALQFVHSGITIVLLSQLVAFAILFRALRVLRRM